ncbi:MAG: lipoprotein [Brachymonas sp.]|nr:lipoprotein [Brachymonas sp.]
MRTFVTAAICSTALLLLAACGQKGDLYIPTEPEAANRATLPRTLFPVKPRAQPAASAPSQASPSAQP